MSSELFLIIGQSRVQYPSMRMSIAVSILRTDRDNQDGLAVSSVCLKGGLNHW